MRREEGRRVHQEFLAAQIAACVINFSMSRPKRGISTRELMPSEMRRERREEAEDLGSQFRRVFAVLEKMEEAKR